MSGFLTKAYAARTVEQTRALYEDWAESYDDELTRNGYATPGRCAEALARHCAPETAVLDIGCGTGLSGVALRAAGFTEIHGADPSAGMMGQAEETGAYASLHVSDPHDPFARAPRVGAIAAIGVIGAGAAPLDLFDQAMAHLPEGGRFVVSFNDHALDLPEYPAKADEWRRRGRLLFEEYGPHIPGIGLNARVYVFGT